MTKKKTWAYEEGMKADEGRPKKPTASNPAFQKWLNEWLVDSDYVPTDQQIEAMEDAFRGGVEHAENKKLDKLV